MTIIQQTINDVNPGNLLMGLIDTALLAQNFTNVYDASPSGTYRVRVYKSAAANNTAGYDWYLAFRWNTVGSEDYFNVFAGENLTGTTLNRATVGSNSSQYGVNADGGIWGDIALSGVPVISLISSGGTTVPVGEILPSSAFGIWVSITPDHFVMFGTGPVINRDFFTLVKQSGYTNFFDGGSGAPVMGRIGASNTLHVPTSVWNSVTPNPVNYRRINILGRLGAALESTVLPALTGLNGLVANAFRPRLYATLSSAGGTGLTWAGTTPPDSGLAGGGGNGAFGGAVRIGDAVDVYYVNAGNLGDTITIGGSTYVISQPNGIAVLDS